jgi:ABC-type branched-subunit amino acid transport system ATPase component/branched-subunit amino acid ABC-type transport system permease component
MHSFLPFIVIGLVSGSVYGLAGTGLVLTYKTSGIFNFAYGSVAAVGVFIFYWLHTTHGLAWPLAAVIVLLVLSPVEGVLFEFLARAIERRTTAVKVVATVGIMLIVYGIGAIWYGSQSLVFPQFLPTTTIKVLGVYLTYAQMIVFAIAVISAASLYYLFRYVRLGIAMRGIVDDADLVALTGENPVRIRRLAWIIGTIFATMAGLLIAPSLGLDVTVITLLVVQAFGAAAIGYFSSLPLTFAGGLLIGVLSALATKYTLNVSWLSGLASGLPFIILFLVLIFMPARKLMERRARFALPAQRSWHAPIRSRIGVTVLALVALALVPPAAGWDLNIWSNLVISVILFLSLGLLVRTSGQISLCQMTFAAIGAAAFGHFLTDWHIPWLIALLLASLVAVPVGALVAIPAIRLRGVFLAVATLGLAILVEDLFYTTKAMFGPTVGGVHTPRPHVSIGGLDLSSGKGFYYLVIVAAALTTFLIIAIERGRMGRLLAALRDSPTALEVHGTDVNVVRTVVFCISAALAGAAGALTGSLYGYAVGPEFDWFQSLVLAVLILIVVGGAPWYALLAAAGQVLIPSYVSYANVANYEFILFGVFAIMYAVQGGKSPEMPTVVRKAFARLESVLGGKATTSTEGLRPAVALPGAGDGALPSAGQVAAAAPEVAAVRAESRPTASGDGVESGSGREHGGLEVRTLSVTFGGVRALVDVSVEASPGVITGLVGPNGAGKTTLFNACSGLIRPTSGRVVLDGRDITGVSRARRAQLGLGRTFQRTELFDSLTVRENVSVGREAALAGSNPRLQLKMRHGEGAQVKEAVDEALTLVGIEHLADAQAGLLTTGQRRLVEFARLLAGSFDTVLLDEPSAGLDEDETNQLGNLLLEVVRRRGTGILLVEHDLALVRRVCHHIYVLDFGQLIFDGNAQEMLESELVRAAYLGSDAAGVLEAGEDKPVARI